MKKLLYLSLLFFSIFMSSGCQLFDDNDFDIADPVVLPDLAVTFIQDNFPDFQIRHQGYEDLCDNTRVLEVELEEGPGPDVDLYFNLDGEFLFSATDIMIDELPQAVSNTIDSLYADYTIDAESVERFDFPDGSVQYEVELIAPNGDDYDLVVAQDGTIVCWEQDDDDDDDDDDDNGNDDGNGTGSIVLPDSIRTAINNTYPGYRIDEVEREDLCDDEDFYVVDLEDGPGADIDLYYSLNWMYQFSATEIDTNQIPMAVSDALAADYPDFQVVADKVERLDYPNGDVAYLLEIEAGNDRDREVLYGSDGTLRCDDEDDEDDDDDDDDNGNGSGNGSASMPDSVRTFINSQYAGYRIDEVERDDLCNDEYFYVVELEDGPGADIDLYFNLNWELSFTATEISTSALPAAVTDAVATGFPGAEIEEDDTERLDYPDGSVQYYLEIETSDEDDYDLIYTSAGVLVCSDRS